MNFVDCVQVVTQIVVACTAVIMAYSAYQTYLRAPEQDTEPEPESPSDKEANNTLKEILVFKTSKQKTYLSVTEQGLACRIEDTREGRGGPQWVLSKPQVQVILESNAFFVNPGYKVSTGTFSLGPRKN